MGWILLLFTLYVIGFFWMKERKLTVAPVRDKLNTLIAKEGITSEYLLEYDGVALTIDEGNKKVYFFRYIDTKKDWNYMQLEHILSIEMLENSRPFKQYTEIPEEKVMLMPEESNFRDICKLHIEFRHMKSDGIIESEQINFFSTSKSTSKHELDKRYIEMNRWFESLSSVAIPLKEFRKQQEDSLNVYQREIIKTFLIAEGIQLKSSSEQAETDSSKYI